MGIIRINELTELIKNFMIMVSTTNPSPNDEFPMSPPCFIGGVTNPTCLTLSVKVSLLGDLKDYLSLKSFGQKYCEHSSHPPSQYLNPGHPCLLSCFIICSALILKASLLCIALNEEYPQRWNYKFCRET